MTPADRILGKFVSMADLARRLGHRNVTTVQGWRERGIVPIRHAPAIIAVSADRPDPVVPADFLPTVEAVTAERAA